MACSTESTGVGKSHKKIYSKKITLSVPNIRHVDRARIKVFYSRASLSLNQIAYVIIINYLYTVTVACAMRHAHLPHGIREISESNHTREEAIK